MRTISKYTKVWCFKDLITKHTGYLAFMGGVTSPMVLDNFIVFEGGKYGKIG